MSSWTETDYEIEFLMLTTIVERLKAKKVKLLKELKE